MDIASFIRASTAVMQMPVQSAVTVKMAAGAMESQATGMEILLQGMNQCMENLQAVTESAGQYIDIST